MKFNWGTGIFLVLVLFLAASAAFIIFAVNQDVNLVHKDYYEKGADYSDQMAVIKRSEPFRDKIVSQMNGKNLQITIDPALAAVIDSGNVVLFRPSGSKFDLEFPLKKPVQDILISEENLIRGRYILKASWYSGGKKFETDQQIKIEL